MRLLLLAGFLLHIILVVASARRESPTIDEFAHLPAGLLYGKTQQLELYSATPPLLRYWMATPLRLQGNWEIPPLQVKPSLGWAPWIYGQQFMEANRDRYLSAFFPARIMILLLSLLSGWLLYLWSRDLFGARTATFSTLLLLLNPTLLAHAHLATTDVGCMATIFLAFFCLRKINLGASHGDFPQKMICFLAFGLALGSKFTALLGVPVVFLYLLSLHRKNVGALIKDSAFFVCTLGIVINAIYGFQESGRGLGSYTFASATLQTIQAALPAWVPLPLPSIFVLGFDLQKAYAEQGEFGSYLLGEWSREGWWYYNLVAWPLKEPLGLCLLFLALPFAWFTRRERWPLSEKIALFGPLVFLGLPLLFLNRLNIGIRFLLPLYPFLFLALGPLFQRLRKKLSYAALTYALAVALLAFPAGYLTYFSEIAAPLGEKYQLLIDSNLDSGQDLYRLAARPEFRLSNPGGEATPYLLYFGHVDPGLYGIRAERLPAHPVKGLLAVSANFLAGYPYVTPGAGGKVTEIPFGYASWLAGHEPIAREGSIYLFRIKE